MQRKKKQRKASLYGNESGATALEFALVAPVFILVIFGIVEFSVILFAKSVVEGATTVTSRLGKTGYEEDGKSRQDMLVELLNERSSGILDPEKIEITTLVYQNFADIGMAEPLSIDVNGNGVYDAGGGDSYQDINGNGQWDSDLGQAGLGGGGDIVVYKVDYPYHIHTPVMSYFLGDNDGNLRINASVVVRNEPYNVFNN